MEDNSEASAAALNAILEDDEEKVWARQSRMREVRRERDKLSEQQEADLARIRDASRADRLLCEAARDAGIVQASPEGSLNQAELANALREQAGRAGIPYKGLSTEELMAVIKQEAEIRRAVLVDQVNHILEVLKSTKEQFHRMKRCEEVVEGNSVKAEAQVNDEVSYFDLCWSSAIVVQAWLDVRCLRFLLREIGEESRRTGEDAGAAAAEIFEQCEASQV